MKTIYKATLGVGLLLVGINVQAQNLQFHYDLGRYTHPETQAGRSYMMLTLEQQSVDKFGDTFYFVDMNFQKQGAVAANWKFMRNLRFWKGPWALHLRYDGGLRFLNTNTTSPAPRAAMSINDAFFVGPSYTYLRSDRKLMLSAAPLYKYIKGHAEPHNWELVGIWKYAPGNGVFSANGFITYWREKMPYGTSTRLMTQPQFWLNLNKLRGVSEDLKLSVGTELRIANNVDMKGFLFAPSIALKWNFGK